MVLTGARTDDEVSLRLMVESRANAIYHSTKRSLWATRDVTAKIVLAILSAAASAPLASAHVPSLIGWCGLLSAVLGAFVVALRMDHKATTHAELATEYISHYYVFELMCDSGDFSGLAPARVAYSETEKREAKQVGAVDSECFAVAEARAKHSETGCTLPE